MHGNFLDICVLEWCKLFGNRNGEYHWIKVVPNSDAFKREMLSMHGIDDAAFNDLWSQLKDYRDNFIAHLEGQETTAVPNFGVAYLLTAFYFRQLQSAFPSLRVETSLPAHFDRYYNQCLDHAKGVLVHVKEAAARDAGVRPHENG